MATRTVRSADFFSICFLMNVRHRRKRAGAGLLLNGQVGFAP